MSDIRTWLEQSGLGRYAEAFEAQDIGVDLLGDLNDADLRELGVASLGDRKRLLKAAAASAAKATAVSAATPSEGAGGLAAGTSFTRPVPAAREGDSRATHDEGERRHATVMFSDLTGYTALNETFDPEEVEAIMGRVRREAIAVIERHGGRVNQFVGDEVMALFGIPVARRDDPQRAVAAALALHQVVDAIAAEYQQRLGRLLSMHTGIQTGLVIARRSDSRSGDYALTGDTVNTAARLRALAQPGEIIVSAQTWQQVSDYFQALAGEPIAVKGKERPLVPYRILGPRAVPRVGSRPLVGRADELEQFEAQMEACQNRQHSRLIFVRGDPGMGKSRLVAEFQHAALERGMLVHRTSVMDFGARTGHDAVRALLQSLLGLEPDADEDSRHAAIGGFASRHPTAPSRYLYELLDVTVPGPIRSLLAATDPAQRHKDMLECLRQVVRGAADEAPLMILIEDLHWADPATLEQFGAIAAMTLQLPLLVVMSTRFAGDPTVGEWRASLHGLPVSSMDLGPLRPEDAIQLAAGAATISAALLQSCVERAEGNPLFLEQLLLNAGEEGAGNLPGSIQVLIQSRMDRLPAADKAALQAAAVWGARVPLEAIRHLLGDPAYDPQTLVEQFLLRPDGDALVFSHALIRDGAYGSLLLARRRQLHRLAAEWVESRDLALAAEHLERAEDPRAPATCLRAALVLKDRFEYGAALALVDRGLRLSQATGAPFDLLLERASLLLELGQPATSLQACGEALSAATGDAEHALGLLAQASACRLLDRLNEGMDLLARAQPLAERAGLVRERARLHHLRGNLMFSLGRIRECRREHELARDLARSCGDAEAEVAALGGLADATYAQGRVRSGHLLFTRCVEMAHERGFLRVEVSYTAMLGWCALYQLDLAGARRAATATIELAERTANQRVRMMGYNQRAMVEGWVAGRWRESIGDVDQALAIARQLGSERFQALAKYIRALLHIRAGEIEAAGVAVREALVLCGTTGRSFLLPQIMGTMLRMEPDAGRRAELIAEAEGVLEAGAVSHNHLIFYDAAIETALRHRDWPMALRYADRLAAYSAPEPFAWADFLVARARVLVGLGSSGPSEALVRELRRLIRQGEEASADLYLAALRTALAAADAAFAPRG